MLPPVVAPFVTQIPNMQTLCHIHKGQCNTVSYIVNSYFQDGARLFQKGGVYGELHLVLALRHAFEIVVGDFDHVL